MSTEQHKQDQELLDEIQKLHKEYSQLKEESCKLINKAEEIKNR